MTHLTLIKSLSQNYLSINNDTAWKLHQTQVIFYLLFISCKQLSESVVPSRVCSLDNPSSIFSRRISFLVCRLFFFLTSFSFVWYMRNITTVDYLLFYWLGSICSIKTYVMMLPMSTSFWFIWYKRLFNNWIINYICYGLYIMSVCWCYYNG